MVISIDIDEISKDPINNINDINKRFLLKYESELYKKSKDMIYSVSNLDAFNYINSNPFKCLYKVLLEKSLLEQDYDVCNKVFYKLQNFRGIKFIK